MVNESSPYLLQHAHNPVDWYPWCQEALQKAITENKMMLISIGYSACHWCHVMEHECFENEELAELMNKHFVCIKVDREERPDIDQIYMNALQLMTGSGGWPLNCFTLPDARPIYAGTYFPRESWKNILMHLVNIFNNDYQKAKDYADKVTEGIRLSESMISNAATEFSKEELIKMYEKWEGMFDEIDGGPNRAPKFPLPNNFQYLLRYYYYTKNKKLLNYIDLTLTKMARGGIYDQVGGGFARYSVDSFWKVPHFEKMLYDNGQLISLYSEAYSLSGNQEYKNVVYQTVEFIERELLSSEYGVFSALDADSEGEEGKYYSFTVDELKQVCGEDYPFVERYYCIGREANWEEGKQILLRVKSDWQYAADENISFDVLKSKVKKINDRLLLYRSKRIRPGLDDKILTSWNALLVSGLTDACFAFGDERFLKLAKNIMQFILSNQKRRDGGLFRSYKNGQSSINAFLDDYSFTIEALIKLFSATANADYLDEAISLMNYTMINFHDENATGFFYTSKIDEPLIARKKEWSDNVIPASNSCMAQNLHALGIINGNNKWIALSKEMLMSIKGEMFGYNAGYSNWSILHLHFSYGLKEVIISGKDCLNIISALKKHFIPNALILPAIKNVEYPIFKNRYSENENKIYLCENNSCQLIHDDLEFIKNALMNNLQ